MKTHIDLGTAPEKSPATEPGLEGLDLHVEGSTSVEPVAPKEVLSEDGAGNLMLIEDLPEDGIQVMTTEEGLVAGLESMVLEEMTQRQTSGGEKQPSILPLRPSPIYSAVVTPMHKIFDLCGDCDMELDVLVHLLYHANETDTVQIIWGANTLTEFEVLDLASAIADTKARVEMVVGTLYRPKELLLIPSCDKVTCVIDNLICADKDFHYGSTKNVETTLNASKVYEEQMFAILQEKGLLTADEINGLKDRSPVTIPASRLAR